MSPTFEATFWGFISGGALVLGAAVGYFARVPGSVVAGVMAFGSGVLISALSFELMDEAFQQAGMTATATGFLLGAAIYAMANHLLAIWGARHRKRSGTQQPSEEDQAGGMLAMIVDTMIPEAFAEVHHWARRFVVLGFLVAFTLTELTG
jgi:ZIP family zinc transporter